MELGLRGGKVTLKIMAKCDDRCETVIWDDDGHEMKRVEGYVPRIVSPRSDYVEIEIDLATGKLVGWQPPSIEQIEEFLQS